MENLILADGKKLIISGLCMQSFPCKHHCTINGKSQTLSAVDIYLLLKTNNLSIPEHFAYVKDMKNISNKKIYSNIRRKQNNFFDYLKNKFL
jgi:hypothetical protein